MNKTEEIYQQYLKNSCVTTDSRNIEKGAVFFALKGANFNGNKYAADAIKKGAICAVVDEEEYHIPGKTILVDDVLLALQKLANHHRKQLKCPILAITGTNGKTTTKELIAAVLSKKFRVSFTQGNLNNHIGVPITLLRMTNETEFGVVEMGANHPGEIADLCAIAEPDYGIITNIGKAHLEGFGSFEGVIKTKGEMYDYLAAKDGTVFYNRENEILETIGAKLKHRISYGTSSADLNGELLQSPPFVHAKVQFAKGVLYLNTQLIGDYNFENVLAAACIGNHFGVDPLAIQAALKNYRPTNNRSQLIKRENANIILDAYNANPTSMKASITSFYKQFGNEGLLILGDMLELGDYSDDEHRGILELLESYQMKNVFLVGKAFMSANNSFAFRAFENVTELTAVLENTEIENGNILIKGSRGIQLEKIVELI